MDILSKRRPKRSPLVPQTRFWGPQRDFDRDFRANPHIMIFMGFYNTHDTREPQSMTHGAQHMDDIKLYNPYGSYVWSNNLFFPFGLR